MGIHLRRDKQVKNNSNLALLPAILFFILKSMEVIMNIFKRATLLLSIKDSAGKSLRKIAEKISTPKSNIHRHLSNRKKRVEQMGHDFFETQEGIEWLCRLLFSTIFIFGIQAGVGSETISLYFHTIFIGSPSFSVVAFS